MQAVLEGLRRVDWRRHGVAYAVLFGSAARGTVFRDVDLAVLFQGRPSLDRVLALAMEVADAVGVPDDRVDLVVLNRDDLPCALVVEALGRGRLVYCGLGLDRCLDDVLRRLKVCWDFEISYRKLDLLRTALEAVKRRWRR